MAPRALLLLGLLTALAARASAASAYPCHKYKNKMGDNVTCTGVALPNGLCRRCPLRPANAKGQFIQCWNTFNTDAPTCLPAMEEYVAANPCDAVRAKAVAELKADPGDGDARSIVDYFLYSVCEQCCDCIPMGANSALYPLYLAAHSVSNPSLYDPTRGNCPAHAFYDICKILPKVTHFTKVGDAMPASANSIPPACPMLNSWFNSPESNGWQHNPKTNIVPPLNGFFLNMLDKLECAKKDVWDKCYALEAAQKHLGVPEEAPEVGEKLPTAASTPAALEPLAPETPAPAPDETVSPPPPVTKNSTVPGGDIGGVSGPGSGVEADVAGSSKSETKSSAPASCFPVHATVELRGGQRVRMDALQIGDEVRVADGQFSTVYLFSHRDPAPRSAHLRVTLSSGANLELTPGHYLPVNGVLAPAASVAPGDVLQGAYGPAMVSNVKSVMRQGLYNPHTVAGTIVVDGVLCSTYTTAVNTNAAQALLAPLRALFRVGAVTEAWAGGFLQYGAESIPLPVPVL